MRSSAKEIVIAMSALLIVLLPPTQCTDDCVHDISSPGVFTRYIDFTLLWKCVKNLVPFIHRKDQMTFYLYKRDFPNCGREIRIDDDDSLLTSGFNSSQQTRILIHGWMSQMKGSFSRVVAKAYLTLASSGDGENDDFNVIVVDWSFLAANFNYFGVAKMVEKLGIQVTNFVRFLHDKTDAKYNDMYLIGHSLGAQIAGSAGKYLQPFKFNTIFALDPAGVNFRSKSNEYRIDPTDATYVESIQTSTNFGFEEPMGNATFYPNYGAHQKCYIYGCSHKRAYVYFSESITSNKGFWGTRCIRKSDDIWACSKSRREFRMGGEPSVSKQGTFCLKTAKNSPYALGRRKIE